MQVLKVAQKDTYASLYAKGEFMHHYTPGSEHVAPEGFPMHVYRLDAGAVQFSEFGECDLGAYQRVALLCEVEPEHFTKDVFVIGLWPLNWGVGDPSPVLTMERMLELKKHQTPEGPFYCHAGAYKLKVIGEINLSKSTPQNIVLIKQPKAN